MFGTFMKTALTLLFAMAVLGCAGRYSSGETPLDRNWGKSFESAKHMQMLNPDAGKNMAPVAGLVGPAAEIEMESYLGGFLGQSKDRKSKWSIPLVNTPTDKGS